MSIDLVYEILKGLLISTLGLLIALLVKSKIENLKDHRTYKWMLEAIDSEAESNKIILHDSFLKYFDCGVVARGFSMETARQYLGNTIFLKQAGGSDIETLNMYLLHLSLANGYREINERMQMGKEKNVEPMWVDLVNKWRDNLKNCYESIDKVRQLGRQLSMSSQYSTSFTYFHDAYIELQLKNLCDNKIFRWTGRVGDVLQDSVIIDIIPHLDYSNAKDVYDYYKKNFYEENLYHNIWVDKSKMSTISLFLTEDRKSELISLSKGDIITFEGTTTKESISSNNAISLSIKMYTGKIIGNAGKEYMIYEEMEKSIHDNEFRWY